MSKMKDKAWKMFALWVKLENADADGFCVCCTCGRTLAFDEQDCNAGHFIAGRNNSVLFKTKIVYPQCYSCNVCKGGEQGKFFMFMRKKGFSENALSDMLSEKHPPFPMKEWQFEELLVDYYMRIVDLSCSKYASRDDIKQKISAKIKSFGCAKIINAAAAKLRALIPLHPASSLPS